MSLAEFILARIAEDEAAVDTIPDWYCTDSVRGEGWGSRGDCPLCGAYMFDGDESATEVGYWDHMEDVHRRTRVLREVKAKRAIVRLHGAVQVWPGGTDGAKFYLGSKRVCASCSDGPTATSPCDTLRALASVYRDADGWREEWA